MIRHWLQDCIANHEQCSLNVSSQIPRRSQDPPVPLPLRVLKVEAGEHEPSIQLVETENQTGNYAALSHCWGKSPMTTTKKDNLHERKSGIKFATLPKTFQDAIIITLRLGTQFIWIDALCIIQDDEDDWKSQAPLMGTIYRNADYTISAASASDGNGGCFAPRKQPPIPPVTVFYQHRNEPSQMTFSYSGSDLGTDVERSPLNSRAWTLQERILSRRLIHFGAGQIYFECQKLSFGEDESEQVVRGQVMDILDLRLYEGLERDDIPRSSWQRPSPFPLSWRWCLLIEEYSKRSLTRHTDKLPALSGLAHEVQKRSGYVYCAGHWSEDLHISLS
jgi:hypothetical protein